MTILRPDKQRVLNYALSQRDLQDQAPNPAGVEVDGRGLAELLSFGARYGALINFYDLSNMPVGDWSVFFQSDPAIAAAVHGALDIPELRQKLRRLLAKARAAETREDHERHTHKIYHLVIRLLVVVDENIRTDTEDIDVHLTIAASSTRQEHICQPLDQLRHHRKQRQDHRDWRLREIELLEELLSTLLDELEAGATAALKAVDSSLQRDSHAPQAALWNAFIMLYRKSRGRLNNFPHRLLDFYYGTLLQQSHRDAVPAQTYLTFELAKNTSLASIPKGTRFSAGTDATGATIYYESTMSLEVVPTSVQSVSVHRIAQNGDGHDQQSIGFLSGTLPRPAGENGASFPAFGGATAGVYGAMEMTPAHVGFIIANPLLMLAGGKRTVCVTLSSRGNRAQPPTPSPPTPVLQEGSGADRFSGEWFSMLYSTAGGWVEVEHVRISVLQNRTSAYQDVEFQFILPPEAPPLVSCSTKALPGAIKPDLPADSFPGLHDQPTIIMRLMNEQHPDPAEAATEQKLSLAKYRALSEIKVSNISFDIKVDDLPPEKLSSSGGLIDPSQNFALFGLAPLKGAFLKLSVPELFVKRPSAVRLTIRWAGLPTSRRGFSGWYRDYVINDDGSRVPQGLFHNDSFRVSFGLTGPGLWSIAKNPETFLFQTETGGSAEADSPPDPSAPLEGCSKLAFACTHEKKLPAYFNPAASELQLTLTGPKYGFGATAYSRNLMAAAAANAAALRQAAPASGKDHINEKVSKLRQTNDTAKTSSYHRTVGSAVQSVLSFLNSEAVAVLHAAIPASRLLDDQKYDLVQSLEAAAGQDLENAAGKIWHRISGRGGAAVDHVDVTDDLGNWLKSFGQMISGHGSNPLHERGSQILAKAQNIADAWEAAKVQPAESARATMAASLNTASLPPPVPDAAILPNPPWLPMASAVRVHYSAHVRLIAPNARAPENVGSPFASEASRANPDIVEGQQSFAHLDLFNAVTRAWKAEEKGSRESLAPLLPPVDGKAALHIDLTQPVSTITLLFVLEAGPEGWSTGESELRWEMKIGEKWTRAAVMSDSTHGLNNSGIVALQIGDDRDTSDDACLSKHLRVLVKKGSINSAYIKSVTTNAAPVTWTPPNGAKNLATTMPAGTISQSEQPLAGIAKIDQPMESFGGVPPLVGRSFDQWMAERLHHKGFAIASDDYAKIGLSAVPSLWQLAVIPATSSPCGTTSPGHVWLVAVAARDAPNISDPTVPDVDPTTLNEIGEIVAAAASPFLQCTVTNPPWVRITVNAELEFSAANTTAAWIAILQEELIQWLSPWIPDPKLGQRPRAYWTRQAIAEFIRNRPYVEGISSLTLEHDPEKYRNQWHYFTSALKHKLRSPTALARSSGARAGSRRQ